jgi:hypothetical protein
MILTAQGNPGVQLEAEEDFMELEPLERATLLNAAVHLCVAAINAIADDYPEDAEDIMERLEEMSIAPSRERAN